MQGVSSLTGMTSMDGGGGSVLEGSVLGGEVWGMMFRRLCRGDSGRAWGRPFPCVQPC